MEGCECDAYACDLLLVVALCSREVRSLIATTVQWLPSPREHWPLRIFSDGDGGRAS
jgi:hypothetical protein